MKRLIWIIFILMLITSTVEAKFLPAVQINPFNYRVTSNMYANYSICTSKNVREAGKNAELKDVYKKRIIYLESRVYTLENEPSFTIVTFLVGIILGLII